MIHIMNTSKIFTQKYLVIFFAILCNVLWGSAFPFIKIGYQLFNITTHTGTKILFAGIRFAVAGIILLLLFYIINKKVPKIPKDNIKNVLSTSIVQTFLEYIFFYIGLSNASASNSSILDSVSAFIGIILAHFIYKNDKLTSNKVIGCVLGFASVLLITFGEGRLTFSFNGEGFIIIASAMFAIGAILSKKATQKSDSITVTGYNLTIGGIMLIITGILSGGKLETVTAQGIAVLVYLSLLSAIAFTLWALLLTYNPVGKIVIYNFIIPVSGTILSALFLHENILRPNYIAALATMSAGIIISSKVRRDKL